jgi:TolA-binding protein
MKRKFLLIFLFIILTGCLYSTSKQTHPEGRPSEKKTTSPETATKRSLTPEEQKRASLEVFKEILKAREKRPLTPETIKNVESLYWRIIREYPESPLAQESYIHLIKLYLRDYNPPQLDRAEGVYREFITTYPSSPVREKLDSLMTAYYYSNQMWKKIIEIHYDRIRRFIETGKIDNPYFLYIYSEAKLHLGDTEEAEKGYKWVIKLAPGTNTAVKAQTRLEQLRKER